MIRFKVRTGAVTVTEMSMSMSTGAGAGARGLSETLPGGGGVLAFGGRECKSEGRGISQQGQCRLASDR